MDEKSLEEVEPTENTDLSEKTDHSETEEIEIEEMAIDGICGVY